MRLTGPLTHTYCVTPGQLFGGAGSAITAICQTWTAKQPGNLSIGCVSIRRSEDHIQVRAGGILLTPDFWSGGRLGFCPHR